MSSQNIPLNNGRQAIINTDVSKIFVLNNRYQKGNYVNNSTYDPQTLYAGTLMGRIAASDILTPWTSNASDGSQYSVGVLADDYVLDSGETVGVTIVDMGDVVKSKIICVKPGDGLDTVVNSRRIKDQLEAQGIKLVGGEEMTGYDNQ